MAVDPVRLSKMALFANMAPEQLTFLAENAWQREVQPGTLFVSSGEGGDTFYVIRKGSVRVTIMQDDGKRVFLAVLATGDTVGELSLIDTNGRSADVEAQEPCSLLCINRATFDSLMRQGGAFPLNLMRVLARRMRLANARIQALTKMDAKGKIAFQILEFADLYGVEQPDKSVLIPLRLTQQDISDLVGPCRESVNKIMGDFAVSRYISVDTSNYITVHNAAALKRRAQ